MFRIAAALIAVLVLARPVSAQEQVVILNPALKACTVNWPDDGGHAQARLLIESATGKAPENDRYYLIHVVKYTGGSLVIGSQHWFVYHEPWFVNNRPFWQAISDPNPEGHFERARIFGNRNLTIVSLSVGVPAATRSQVEAAARADYLVTRAATGPDDLEKGLIDELKASRSWNDNYRERDDAYLIKVAADMRARSGVAGQPTLLQSLAAAAASNRAQGIFEESPELLGATNFVALESGKKLVRLSSEVLATASFEALSKLTYKATITKKKPEPLQNLEAIAKLAAAQAGGSRIRVSAPPTNLCTAGAFVINDLPSDVKVQALVGDGDKQKELGTQTYDNERRYNFDFSLALPLKTRRDVTVDVENRQISAKTIEKTDVFAFLNLSPVPIDTKRVHAQYLPRLVYGMPITGKPLQHHILGLAIGINRGQVFAGWRWDRNEVVSGTEASGSPTITEVSQVGTSTEKWTKAFVWGLNMPVSTVVKALTPKK